MADPNILMQFKTAQMPSMLDSLSRAASTKNEMMKSQAMQQEMDQQSNLDKAYRLAGGDVNKMQADPSIGFNAGMQISAMQSSKAKQEADAQNAKIEHMLKGSEYTAQLASGVQDQAGWDHLRQETANILGPEYLSHMPEQFSPQARDQYVQGAVSFKDKLAMQREERQAEYQNASLDMMGRRIDASERNAQARGDGGEKTKYAIIYDAQGNAYTKNVNAPNEPPIPMTMPSSGAPAGQPSPTGTPVQQPPASFRKAVSGAPQASEDERKAAGWVNQARLASQQMGSAMETDPNASSQGILEAVLPEGVARQTLSEQRQRFNDAASSFSEAALRAATGAGINESEAKQKIMELTPRFGDKPATIKDKMARQEMYLQSLESRAGRALNMQPQQPTASGDIHSQAADWVRANPNDPRAAAIRQRLGL